MTARIRYRMSHHIVVKSLPSFLGPVVPELRSTQPTTFPMLRAFY